MKKKFKVILSLSHVDLMIHYLTSYQFKSCCVMGIRLIGQSCFGILRVQLYFPIDQHVDKQYFNKLSTMLT